MSFYTRLRKHNKPKSNIDAVCESCGAKWKTTGDKDFLCLICKHVIKAVLPEREDNELSIRFKITNKD